MLALTSTAFQHGGAIPSLYTCDGRDIAPPLAWTGVPTTAKSLSLIVDDPDAPDPDKPKMTWVHWVLYNIPSSTGGLPEGATSGDLPKGTLEGQNDWHRTVYIDAEGVRTTDFDLSDAQVQGLVDSGVKCSTKYFEWFEDAKENPVNRV